MTLQELQREVGAWSEEHFGPATDDLKRRTMEKFHEEQREFQLDPCAEEAADVVLVLLSWAHRNGVDLSLAVSEKFAKVRTRNQLARDAERGIVAR